MAAKQSFKSHSETLLPRSKRTMKHTLEVEASDDDRCPVEEVSPVIGNNDVDGPLPLCCCA